MVDEDKMPQRWEMPPFCDFCDYRPAANGDWVRVEDVESLVDEITRLRAHNEKMLAHSVDLERMISFGVATPEDLLEVVRAMREEDKP